MNPSEPIQAKLYTWIFAGSFTADMGFQVDTLSAIMLFVVCGVGFLVHVYSIGYMRGDPSYYRFFTYLNLFMTSMLILVLADNYLLMFVGWEGVGLCSYLLIGFWYDRQSASDAGKKAFLVNRIGDAGFILAMSLIFWTTGSLNYDTVFTQAAERDRSRRALPPPLPCCCLSVPCGKSAQVPLYVWLPDAMEGPTPVSALIHAATMVTAGVYMVVRSQALFLLAPMSMHVVAGVGAFTALFAASIGLVQNDIKRVLAYSTVSQLGYMFLGCGVGAFSSGLFHVMTHAFFKGLLFLGAGSVIHAMHEEQDMRRMGGLRKHIPAPTDHAAGHHCHCRYSALCRILEQRRNSRGGGQKRRPQRAVVADGAVCRVYDFVLHVPPHFSDVLRPGALRHAARASARIAIDHVDALKNLALLVRDWWHCGWHATGKWAVPRVSGVCLSAWCRQHHAQRFISGPMCP